MAEGYEDKPYLSIILDEYTTDYRIRLYRIGNYYELDVLVRREYPNGSELYTIPSAYRGTTDGIGYCFYQQQSGFSYGNVLYKHDTGKLTINAGKYDQPLAGHFILKYLA